MTPAAAIHAVAPTQSAAEAMVEFGRSNVTQLPVMEAGRVQGLASRKDRFRLLSLYGDPALAS